MQKLVGACGLVLLGLSTTAAADSVLVGHLQGATGNAFPFGGAVNAPGTRYQQAYAAAGFSGLGPIAITGLEFLNGSRQNLAASTYTISFSTITASIDALSNSDFDLNRGPDNAFFTSVTLGGVAPAQLVFTGNAFVYDPSKGNLLLDIVVSPGGQDANVIQGVSYAFNAQAPGLFSRYHNFGLGTIGMGLVTQFNYTAVPEPASAALIGLGLIATLLFTRRV